MMPLSPEQKQYIRSSFASMQDKKDLLALLNKAKLFLYGDDSKKPVKKIPLETLTYYANTTLSVKRYETFTIKKKNGKERVISAPVRGLRVIQRCLNLILQCVFEKELERKEKKGNKYVMGFIPNRSIRENAAAHVHKNYVYNIDLQDFFHQIELHRVKACLKLPPFKLDSPSREPLAFLIANLCCEKIQKERINENGETIKAQNAVLPQGAPTSPVLSNIVCQQLDNRLGGLAKRFNCTYTRYADDITFSSQHNVYQEGSEFITELHRIINDQKFTINTTKTRLQKSSWKQEVTGLIVNEKVNVNQHYLKNFRTILHNWEKMGRIDAEQIFLQYYKGDKGHLLKEKPSMQYVLEGKLNFLKMVRGAEDNVYKKLRERFEKLKEGKNKSQQVVRYKEKNKENNTLDIEDGKKEKIVKHNPYLLVQLLKNFSKHETIKYATHNWEKDKFIDGYDTFMKLVTEKWIKDFNLLKSLNERLDAKIWAFLLANSEKKTGWGEYKILIGWGSEELTNYSKKGHYPFNFELPETFAKSTREFIERNERKKIARFSDIIEIFKNEIEFRDSRSLRKVILGLASEYLPKSDYNVTFGDLGFSFYTDVHWIKKSIVIIFESFKEEENRKTYTNIHIWAKRNENSVFLYITQKGSSVENKSFDDPKFWETGGTFDTLRENFNSLCNWSIEAKFKDNKYYRLNLLHHDNNIPKIESIGEVEGFTHILQFFL